MLTCMIVVSCTVLTHYRRLASSLRLPPHTLYSLSLVSHRVSTPDGCMFVYMEAQYVLVKTVIFSAKLSRFDRLPLLSSPRFVSPRATVRSASKSRSILSLISIVSVLPLFSRSSSRRATHSESDDDYSHCIYITVP